MLSWRSVHTGKTHTQARSGVESGVTDSTQVTENPALGERNRISPVKQNKRWLPSKNERNEWNPSVVCQFVAAGLGGTHVDQ
jgi:hypothetical protein